MLFYRKKHVMADVGFGLTNKISWSAPAVAQHTRPRALGSFRNGYSPLVAIAPQVLQRRRGAAVAAAQFAQGCDGRSPAPGPAPSHAAAYWIHRASRFAWPTLGGPCTRQRTRCTVQPAACAYTIHHATTGCQAYRVSRGTWLHRARPMPLRYAGKNLAHVLAASRA